MSNEDGSSPAFPHDANPGVHGPGYGISQRAYAAIHLRVPDSGLPWLDEMIERARRDEVAKAVAQGFAADPSAVWEQGPNEMATYAYKWADAVLAQGRKG